eukprot:TRINITY_DN244_c0_g2_i3.p1 TRINITY_DN244_c0_g2~~TRINITY_DN244_c0_g2_i3.p1  ORF type:complete len:129 (-),score=4.46 TRINITY_DN244_c0_g2_i3:182-568(-)
MSSKFVNLSGCHFKISNTSSYGMKKGNRKNRKGYIKNKAVYNLLKQKGLVKQAKKYSAICNLNSVENLSGELVRLHREDLAEIVNSEMATNPEEKEEKEQKEGVEPVEEDNLNDPTKSLIDPDAPVHK